MPTESTTGTEGQAPTSQTGEGQAPGTEQQGSEGQAPQPLDLSTLDDATRAGIEALVAEATRKANAEAARYRTERNTLNTQVTEAQRAAMTEQQRAQHDLETARAEARQAREEADALRQQQQVATDQVAVTSEAGALGFVNPALAMRLLDPATIQRDQAGKPTNLRALLNALAQSDPYLVRRGAGDGPGGRRGAAPASGGMNDLMRGVLGHG